jgi:hypothetical protein
VDYYQPVDARQRYFLETNLKYVSKISGIYQNDNKLAEYRILQGSARFGAGINLGALGQARAWLGGKLVESQAGYRLAGVPRTIEAVWRLVCPLRPGPDRSALFPNQRLEFFSQVFRRPD